MINTYSKVVYTKKRDCGLEGFLCEKCGSKPTNLISVPDYESSTGSYCIYICPKTKLGFTNPCPSLETASYLYEAKDTSDFDPKRGNPVIENIKDWMGKRLFYGLVENKDQRDNIKNILDYGTGNGRFAVLASEVFPNAKVDAVDYQTSAGARLKNIRNSKIQYIHIDNFSNLTRSYDIIILRHVLEHTNNPVALLKNLTAKLSKNGLIYIEVPNLYAGGAKVFRKYWPGFYVPRHIFHYTKDSLRSVCKAAGLKSNISENEMPFMGNMLKNMFNLKQYGIILQIIGVLLYPLQLIIDLLYRQKSCVNAICRKM